MPHPSPEARLGGEPQKTIAVIEDDPTILSLIRNVLSSGGYRVVATNDPTKALELVREAAPDLVLCDITMPDMDGYRVLKALQAEPATARFPVVFLTANREFTERVQAFRFGVVDYVTKPFTRDLLLKKVERVLHGLSQRPGLLAGSGDEARSLLEDAQRDARTGVLRVTGDSGASQVVIQAGQVVEGTTPVPSPSTSRAEFQELDPTREQIVAHDPAGLPGTAAGLPSFDALPEQFRTVLVVDDNPMFRRFLRDLLAANGFRVHEAAGGEAALATALEQRPWLILTDVRMPDLDGFEFCRRVRSHSLIRHTPLIFLSGWDDYKDRYKGLEAGADEYLSKQTPVRELLIRVQLLLQRLATLERGRHGPGMEGSIEIIGAPGLLQMCHIGSLTGRCHVEAGERELEVRFREGEIVGAESGPLRGADAVFDLLSWTEGRFSFTPGDPGEGTPLGETFDQLILEGCRRLDEQRRDDETNGDATDGGPSRPA